MSTHLRITDSPKLHMNRLKNPSITTWPQFNHIVRRGGYKILNRLDEFPNSILVSGCQRSGTTMLARIITESDGMTNYWFGKDDELDAALILSGYVEHTPSGRYCFQTTYVNQNYPEYYDHSTAFKMIWLIRNPYSVVYSLMYNWSRSIMRETFKMCAAYQLSNVENFMFEFLGSRWVSPIRQASLLYKAKTLHLLDLLENLPRNKILVVDYDDLVLDKDKILRQIYQFAELDYSPEYSEKIHSSSIDKRTNLSSREKRIVERLTMSSYQTARRVKSI